MAPAPQHDLDPTRQRWQTTRRRRATDQYRRRCRGLVASRPLRASRHHVNNWLTDRLYRRAVAETCRRPPWLSATIRCFSANVQRRRAPVEITSRRETFELG